MLVFLRVKQNISRNLCEKLEIESSVKKVRLKFGFIIKERQLSLRFGS